MTDEEAYRELDKMKAAIPSDPKPLTDTEMFMKLKELGMQMHSNNVTNTQTDAIDFFTAQRNECLEALQEIHEGYEPFDNFDYYIEGLGLAIYNLHLAARGEDITEIYKACIDN